MSETGESIELRGVSFAYPGASDCLHDVTLVAQPAALTAVVGPNGAGKSTALRMMAGLSEPRAGSVLLSGRALHSIARSDRAKRIALLPQRVRVDADLSVREVVQLGRYPYRQFGLFGSSGDEDAVVDALQKTSTEHLGHRRISTLSGGEAQRVHLAAALAQSPRVLLLDEPTASLDVQHQLSVLEILRTLVTRDRITVVLVTHDLNHALRYADAACLLASGEVIAQGAPSEVLAPDTLSVAYHANLRRIGETDLDPGFLVAAGVAPGRAELRGNANGGTP